MRSVRTNYTYDWMGNLSGVSMPRATGTQTRTFVYDDAGRLTSATNPETGTVTYSYNTDNTLHVKTDAKGQTTTYAYDPKKRLTSLKDPKKREPVTHPPSVPGGGGGPEAGDYVKRLLKKALLRVKDDLAKTDCAKDFRDTGKTVAELNRVSIGNLGEPSYKSNAAGVLIAANGAVEGRYNLLTGHITLNSWINWADPTNSRGIVDGQQSSVNMLSGLADQFGARIVTPEQYMDLVILHELSHYNGAIGNPNNDSEVETRLWKDCIKQI